MTRSKKLDTILYGLLSLDVKRLNEEPINTLVTIEWLSNSLKLDCENWEMKSLEKELIVKEYITEINGELHITDKGKQFITKQGFVHTDKILKQEDEIRNKTIEKFRYDKISFWFSIIAIIIAGISLVMTLI